MLVERHSLPFACAYEEEPRMTGATTTGQRLLVVESDPENGRRMIRALTDLGYDVVGRAPSGLRAMDAVSRHQPDLALVNVRLPGAIGGPDVARAIDEVYRIPTIYICGENDDVEVGRTLRSAPYGFLRIPPGHHQLQAIVELALYRTKATTKKVPDRLSSRQRSNGKPREPRYRRHFQRSTAGAFEADETGEITDANPALATLLGYDSRAELLERSLADVVSGSPASDRLLERIRTGEALVSEEVQLRTKQDAEVVVLLCTNVVRSAGEDGRRVVGTVMDITRQKRHEFELERQAFEDHLTGLANRRAVEEHAARYLPLADRQGHPLGLIYMDLARFKEINDRFGHPAGDDVLIEVARRLEAGARESDVVGRVGGDEFLVLLPDVSDVDDVMTVVLRMERELETPIELDDDTRTTIRAEMGVSLFPDHGSNLEELLRAADRAMYRAKESRDDRERRRAVMVAGGDMGTDELPTLRRRNRGDGGARRVNPGR